MANYAWQYFDAYRLNVEIMNAFLVDTFGQRDYGVHLSNDNIGFWYERALDEDEKNRLMSRRLPSRRPHRGGR